MSDKANIAAIILAAGEASRMGQPKQLLPIDHQSLIQKAVDTAAHAGCQPVMVVLGAHAALVRKEIQHKPVVPVLNEQWQEGMGTSISTGIRELLVTYPKVEAAIIMLCDQPLVTPSLLQELIQKYKTSEKPIAASLYKGTLGVPALFHRSFFDQLQDLKGSTGARKLIRQHIEQAAIVLFEQGVTDLDTPEDYENFISEKNR